MLVMSPAEPQTVIENLGFLSQDALEVTRGDGQASSLSGALLEAGFGSRTRGAVALDDGEDGPSAAIISIEIDAVPANQWIAPLNLLYCNFIPVLFHYMRIII